MEKDYRWLFFDLDGTLTDPGEGITRSVQYALRSFGIEVEDRTALYPFIGPPLADSFREFYGFGREDSLRAVEKYHEYFRRQGIFENRLYPGMDRLLENVSARGYGIAMATSKPAVFARRIAEHFGIARHFDFISGSGLDGTRTRKAEVIGEALRRLKIDDPARALMIGDRRFDMEGAAALGLDSAGVLYGYGTPEEIAAAHPTYTAGSVAELERLLLE